MANVEHSSLTGSALHEPKGTATANSGEVYVANGSGSGTWQPIHRHLGAATAFSSTSPYAYTIDTDTVEKFLSFPVSSSHVEGFTVLTSPNLRFRYDDPTEITSLINVTMSSSQAGGVGHAVQWALFKNGVEIVGSRAIRTISSGSWGSISVTGVTTLNQNDYIEIKTKADADNVDVNYANIYVSIIGMSA
ncbi:gp29 [Roseobacter phage SIO1]|uniref:Gp29 n=1 Tax=Roseobacter phage SIO1 TaxID=2905867 RepID=Q9G0F5_9CAUD|nr:gp29 [Roseobacter phage SIO1]AAG02613.1 gp29 [Roseobacter phage SIO1]